MRSGGTTGSIFPLTIQQIESTEINSSWQITFFMHRIIHIVDFKIGQIVKRGNIFSRNKFN